MKVFKNIGKLEYKNGFYSNENDGIHSFRWMSNAATLKIKDGHDGLCLNLSIGNPSSQSQNLKLAGNNEKIITLPPGWSDQKIILDELALGIEREISLSCQHTLKIKGDTRILSLMVHAEVDKVPYLKEQVEQPYFITSTIALLEGWYDEEKEGTRTWRWTSPFFTIAANTCGKFIKILCDAVLDLNPGAQKVADDYATILAKNLRTAHTLKKPFTKARSIVVFEMPIQKGDIISFSVNPVFRPPQDSRELGIQIEKIEIVEHYNDISFTEYSLRPFDNICNYAATLPPNFKKTNSLDVTDLKLVFAFYYIWYNTPEISGFWRHWDGKKLNDGVADNICNHPLLGLYDSSDGKIIKEHIRLAEYAGINSFIVCWWNDERDLPALKKLGEQLSISNIKIAFHIEYDMIRSSSSIDDIAENLFTILQYVPDSVLMKIEGRPIFFIHIQTLSIVPAIYWTDIKKIMEIKYNISPIILCDECININNIITDGVYNYNFIWSNLICSNLNVFKDSFIKAFPNTNEKAINFCENFINIYDLFCSVQIQNSHEYGAISTATVFPGFDDIFLYNGYGLEMSRCNGSLMEGQWKTIINEQPNFVLINSWNEWHEGTDIEPNTTDGNLYIEITKKYINEYKNLTNELKHIKKQKIFNNNRKIALTFPQRIPASYGLPSPGSTDLNIFLKHGYTLIHPPVDGFIKELEKAKPSDVLIFPGDQFVEGSSTFQYDILENVKQFIVRGGIFYILGHAIWPMYLEANMVRDIMYYDAQILSGGMRRIDFPAQIGIQLANRQIKPEEYDYEKLIFKSDTYEHMPEINWSPEFTCNWFPAKFTNSDINIKSFNHLIKLFYGANSLGTAVAQVIYESGGICYYVHPELVRCRSEVILEALLQFDKNHELERK